MAFLKFLEGIRTPFLDTFFSAVTHLGEETIFILVGLIFFWCISKKEGYYMLTVGFAGTVINQFLKLMFRIPRPWVRDPDFKAVESAIPEATGYSFPSGHTQTAVGVFGIIARLSKKAAVKILCIIICLSVPFSRMYLGVHTPADVGVSFIIATVLVLVLHPVINKASQCRKNMRIFMGSMLATSVAYLAFVLLYRFPENTENIESGIKNAYKILGCIVGLWVAYEIDNKFIKFDTKAVWWVQIIKLVLGVIPLLAIKALLKAPLYALFNGNYIADAIRYFSVVLFAAGIWPFTFKYFAKLSKKQRNI